MCSWRASKLGHDSDQQDKGERHIKHRFSMYLPHAIALWALLMPRTLGLDDCFTICSNIMISTKR